MARHTIQRSCRKVRTPRARPSSSPPSKTRFTLYDLAGRERARYLVDRVPLEEKRDKPAENAVAHGIVIIDRSGSMRRDLKGLKETLLKLFTLDEYSRANLIVTLLSYASQGDLTVHFQRVAIQDVMKPSSPYLREVRKMQAGARTCMSQALMLSGSLARAGETTAITLHSDGYANDPSPASEERALEALVVQLRERDIFVNTIAYSDRADFRLLSRIASALSGACVRAGDLRQVYDTLYLTTKALAASGGAPSVEALPAGYAYQVLVSHKARKVIGSAGPLRVCGLAPGDDAVIYRYREVPAPEFDQARDFVPAQTSEPVYALARAKLAEGSLNTAKFALASTFDATLAGRDARALTNGEVARLAGDLDEALFNPAAVKRHEILGAVPVNNRLPVLEVVRLLAEHRDHVIVNRRHLEEHYARRGLKRIPGTRDEEGNLVKPWLKTLPLGGSDYARIASIDINHTSPTINLLLTQRVQLVNPAEGKPVTEVASVLLDELAEYRAYTIVSDGEVNVPELRVKISSPQVFAALREKGVLELAPTRRRRSGNGRAEGDGSPAYDFQVEYTIRLADRPLVPVDSPYPDLPGVFEQLAEAKVVASLLAACLREEPGPYAPEQLAELRRHYLTKNLNVSFPTTTQYRDLREALAEGKVDSRVGYRVEIGSRAILNLGKLPSANDFLERMYEAYDKETGKPLEGRPTCDLSLDPHTGFRHGRTSARTQVTPVDEFMRRLFDDFLGLEYTGSVAAVLARVGADGLRRLLQERRNGGTVGRGELVEAMAAAEGRLRADTERLYREKVCPLVFYVGSTGLLPDGMEARAETAEVLAARYPHLQFSRDEQEGTYFEVGDTILGVYPRDEYFTP
jgi:Mg-chelatase subunit ChlD